MSCALLVLDVLPSFLKLLVPLENSCFGHGIFPVGLTDHGKSLSTGFFQFNTKLDRMSLFNRALHLDSSTTPQNNCSLRARSTLCKGSDATEPGRVVYLTSSTKVPAHGDHPPPLPLG